MSHWPSTEDALARAVATRPGAPGRAESLVALEARAAELDGMKDPAERTARRRALLIELEVAGLLSAAHPEEVRAELAALPVLAGYHAAVQALLRYLGGAVRRRDVPGAPAVPVRGAPISLDWFRLAGTPPADERTALGEGLLRGARVSGPEGEFAAQAGGEWYSVHWRADDGATPALLELRAA